MKTPLRLAALAVLVIAGRAQAADQRVMLNVRLHATPAGQIQSRSANIEFESVSSKDQAGIRVPLTVPGSIETTLPTGVWRAELHGDHLFHEPQIIVVRPTASSLQFALDVWLTTDVRGQISVSDGVLPKTVSLRWTNVRPDVPEAERIASPPRGEVRCPVDGGAFSCEVPIGEFDLRVRAERFVSKYLWSVRASHEVVDLGALVLSPGASIVGWIKPERGMTADLTKAVIELIPQTSKKSTSVTVNARGFFHAERVPPGEYVVNARLGALSVEPFTVQVSEGIESELIDDLVLARPRVLTVQVQPPHTFSERPWQVRLERVQDDHRSALVAQGETDASGRVVLKGVRPGIHTLLVAEDSRSTVAARELEVIDEETVIQLEVPRTRVTGRVTFRDRGAVVRLWLGGRNHIPSVEVVTDDDGRYSAVVPFDPAKDWLVALESKAPRIVRTLKLRPSFNEATREATLDITLPANGIAGHVVDESGALVEQAIVNLAPKGEGGGALLQTLVAADGAFEFEGVDKGAYEIQASDNKKQQSDAITVVVDDSQPHHDIELVVRKKLVIIGKVIASSGRPVPNAEVTAMPTDRPFLHAESAVTDTDGVFSLSLPPETRGTDFMIASNGFALKAFHVPAPQNGLTIVVEPTGGLLAFDVPQFVDDPTALHPYFGHKGAWIAALALVYRPGAALSPSERGDRYLSLRHPFMDDGDYSLCMLRVQELPAVRSGALPPGRCVSGYLAPWGSLDLKNASE